MDKVLTKYTSRRVIEFLLQNFVFLKNVYEFFKFSVLIPVRYNPIHHEHCISIIFESAGRERNKFRQLSKLI